MNFQQDLKNGAKVGLALTVVNRLTNTAGSSVDLNDCELQHSAVLITAGLSDGTHAVKLQESTDASTWTDVTNGNFATFTTAAANTNTALETINFKRSARYVRATATITATTGGAYGVLIVAQKKTTGGAPQLT